jgi:adenosyl cobinamide kinase/adenosyl cobinamide phosphate guanylyltransferase
MGKITLITGGSRSGKSRRALVLAREHPGAARAFVATAEARDDEMRERIARHQAARAGEFETLEEPLDLAAALQALHGRAEIAVLDCLTLWVSNLMESGASDDDILSAVDRLAAAMSRAPFDTIVVTDEVGGGIVPDNPIARRFRDLLGWTNQRIGAAAATVILMVAGEPLRVK